MPPPEPTPGRAPRYVERAPHDALAPYVECVWSLRGEVASPVPNRVLPDGCADVIVDLARDPRAYVVGTMRRAAVIPLLGRVDLVGVRFRPGAALPFLDTPLDALVDRHVALDALWGAGAAGSLVDEMASAGAGDGVGRGAGLERALLRRLAAARAEPGLVARAAALMRRARGRVSVAEVAAALGVGERRLGRAFDAAVGIPPKQLARVLRFRAAVRQIERGAAPRWTAIALDAGYADQAHFIREFRSFAGLTPSAFAAERRGVGFVQYDGEGGP
jgi:AraC-like DNA-binding protein